MRASRCYLEWTWPCRYRGARGLCGRPYTVIRQRKFDQPNLQYSIAVNSQYFEQGHSLGAGYAQLAYVELFRKLNTSNTSKAYKLKSLYAFAAPRVSAILGTGFAQTVKEVFEGSGKPIFRYSNEYDVVPFAPGIVTEIGKTGENIVSSGWIHLDGGYILRRNASEAPYWTPDTTEICRLPKGDQDGRTSWEHHCEFAIHNLFAI